MLRDRDLLVTPAEVIDALRTANAIDLIDRLELKLALRTVLTGRREDIPVFDATFDDWANQPRHVYANSRREFNRGVDIVH